MCTHTCTERHIIYQFILQFSGNTKTEAGKFIYHVLLTMTHVLAVLWHQDHTLQDTVPIHIGHT